MGIEVVAAVNCKRNLDVHQNPDDSRPYAERDGTSVLMTTAFGDGTKMQIENAVVANLTGLVPDRLGMHGVETDGRASGGRHRVGDLAARGRGIHAGRRLRRRRVGRRLWRGRDGPAVHALRKAR